MKTQRILAILVLLALVASAPAVAVGVPSATPQVDGRFYGNNDRANYTIVATALDDRGTLYQHYDAASQVLYLAVEVAPKVNDNVFGDSGNGKPDEAYVKSAGWKRGAGHLAGELIRSDNVGLSFWCNGAVSTWYQGYLYDLDGDEDPAGADWRSTPADPSGGGGTPPAELMDTASTMAWNMNNTTWDVTLGGSRTNSDVWKSPDSDPQNTVVGDGYSDAEGWYWSDSDVEAGWEWAIVYEMSLDVSGCGGQYGVDVLSAHNSPAKDYEDVPIPVADLGDAPDPNYPTLLANLGAYHVLPLEGSGPMLGPTVDQDADGQPEAHAQGDDYLDEGDDEDGICFCAAPVMWGQTGTVDVTVMSQDCFVNGWIDFNADGSWAEAGDQILSDLPLSAGTIHYPTFTVPEGSGWLVTYSRFRCSSVDMATGGYTHIGRAPDGEVEDYELVVNDVPVEFGDLPDIYGTTLGHTGAYHFVVSDFFLGFSADGEGNGNPSPGADGDDSCPPGGDDEDGVLIPVILEPGATNQMQVYLTDGSGRGGVLDAWMDFDANGWDSGDRILTGYSLSPGWNTVPFDVPWYGPAGEPGGLAPSGTPVYSRFRLSPAPALLSANTMGPAAIAGVDLPTGPGGIGEVEDYKTEAPTAVKVASFTASQAGAAVLVEWETASEIDNLGFNLYRAEAEDGVRIQLNGALIPTRMPPGSPVGAVYEFVDGNVEPGVLYDYWLEAADIHGQVETFGPVSAGLLTLEIDPGLWSLGTDAQEAGEDALEP